MPGGIPKSPQQRVRRNIEHRDRNLPATGRRGRPPKSPLSLGDAGRSWWAWAWSTPQAIAWDKGHLYALARRAQCEDRYAALERTPEEMKYAVIGDLNKLDATALKLDTEFGLTLRSALQLHLFVEKTEDAPSSKVDDGDNVLDMRNRAKALMAGNA